MVRNEQRFLCKECGYNFVDKPRRGVPLKEKIQVLLLHLNGLSLNATAKIMGVSTPTIMRWVAEFAEKYAEKPEPSAGGVVVMELDEMGHYLKKSLQTVDLEGLLSRYRPTG